LNIRKQILVSAGTVGVMLAAAGWAYGRLPAQLAVRWDIHGAAAGFLDRGLALLIVPAITVILTALFALAPALMPERSRLERSTEAWSAVWMVVLGTMLFGQVLMVVANLGVPLNVPRLASLVAAVVIFVVGNWLGKVRHNFIFGLRTPWTLADERVWDKTHRFTGRLMVLCALVLAVAALVVPVFSQSNLVLFAILIASAAGPALAGIVYSASIARPANRSAANRGPQP